MFSLALKIYVLNYRTYVLNFRTCILNYRQGKRIKLFIF